MTTLLPTRSPRTLGPWVGRDPFRSLRDEMDELFGRFVSRWDEDWPARTFTPDLDLFETEDAVQIDIDLPGIKPEEIDIAVTGNTVRISGERKKDEKEEKGRTYLRTGRSFGAFSGTFTLPCAVDESKIKAQEKDGVLTIVLPKTERAKTRRIKVKVE
jgi:HSP20 family protein